MIFKGSSSSDCLLNVSPPHLSSIKSALLFPCVSGAKFQAVAETEYWQDPVRDTDLRASGGAREGDQSGLGGQGDLPERGMPKQGEGLTRGGRPRAEV